MATKKTTKKAGKKPSKKSSGKNTYVAIVLDRSGSMTSIHKETVGGINEQFAVLKENAKLGGNTLVTLIQFDNVIETVFDGVEPASIKNLEMTDFQPRGATAMYDAIWAAIARLKQYEVTDDTGFLVCVISDGEENSSREVSQYQLSEEIKKLQETGKWTFTYMLANQDIHQVAHALNVPVSNMVSFTADSVSSVATYTNNATCTAQYFGARSAGIQSVNCFYEGTTTDEPKDAK